MFWDNIAVVLKDYAIVTIGVLTLLVASAAAYEILNINTQIQAKPEQIKMPDYTSELDSLKSKVDSMNSQINSMNGNLAVLDTLKNNVADIQGKLNDIENKGTLATQAALATPLALVLDKPSYSPGDTITITAIGVNPLKSVEVELLDSSGFVLVHKETWSDSAGKLSYGLQLSSSLLAGNYNVNIISDKQTQSQPITIVMSTTTQTTTSSSTFTAQTDKSVYQSGDLIQLSGKGKAGSSITAVMTSPSAKTYSSFGTIQTDGSYVMLFSTPQPFEIGQWNIAVTNLGQTKTVSVYFGSGTSTGSNTFTTQTDKTIYHPGDPVQITGTGTSGSSVTALMTSPSAKTYSISTTVRADGFYAMVFSTIPSDQIGQWNITVTNLGQSKPLAIYMQ